MLQARLKKKLNNAQPSEGTTETATSKVALVMHRPENDHCIAQKSQLLQNPSELSLRQFANAGRTTRMSIESLNPKSSAGKLPPTGSRVSRTSFAKRNNSTIVNNPIFNGLYIN